MASRPIRHWLLSIALTAVCAAIVLAPHHARAATDDWCGTTLTGDLTLVEDLDCTGEEGVALTIGAHGVTIDGNGFRILAPDASRAILSNGYDDLTVRNVDLSGWCRGIGLYVLGGNRLIVENVRADGRSYGSLISGVTDVRVHDFDATNALTTALGLSNVGGTIDLANLSLTNSTTGLDLTTITELPLIDTTTISDISGNDTSIRLSSGVTGLTIDGLTLDGHLYGVWSYHTSNDDLTFRHLNVSGSGVGHGIYTQGATVTIEDIDANRRLHGVYTNGTSDLSISDIRAAGTTSCAVYVRVATQAVALKKLALTDSVCGLGIYNYAAPTPLVIDDYVTATDTGVVVSLARNKTPLSMSLVDNIVVGLPAPATPMTFEGTDYGIYAVGNGPFGITIQNVDVVGKGGTGTGIYMYGINNRIEDVAVTDFAQGVDILSSTNLTLRNLRSDNHAGNALKLTATTLPLTLEALSLTRSSYGLFISGLAADSASPLLLDVWDATTNPDGAIASLLGNDSSLRLDNVQNVTLDHLRLDGRSYGLYAWDVNNDGLNIVDVNAAGHGAGYGLGLRGGVINATRVVASDRANGLFAQQVGALTIADLTAHGCRTNGLDLYGFTDAHAEPALSGLSLRDNATALQFSYFDRSLLLDGDDVALDITGSTSGIRFLDSSLVTVQDYPNLNATRTDAIYADAKSHDITLKRLNVSGVGVGSGVHIAGGANYVLEDIVASHRANGVLLRGTSNAQVTRLTANGSNYGLQLYQSKLASGHLPPVFAGLDLRDNNVGLYLGSNDVPMAIDGSAGAADLKLEGTTTSIELYYVSDLTLTNVVSPGRSYGINATYTCQRLILDGIDARSSSTGTGIKLGVNATNNRAGAGHRLRHINTDGRYTGMTITAADDLLIDDFSADGCRGVGLILSDIDASTGLSLRQLSLTNSYQALNLYRVNGQDGAPVILDAFDAGDPDLPDDDTGVFADLSGNTYGIYNTDSSWLTFDGLIIDGKTYGIDSYASSNLSFNNLDVSGRNRTGDGLKLRFSDDIAINNVRADYRAYGVTSSDGTNIAVTDLHTDRSQYGFYSHKDLGTMALTRLTLTRAYAGLTVSRFTGPLDIGPSAITSVAGSEIGVNLSVTDKVHVHDLIIPGQCPGYGVYAAGDNTELVIENMDVSGHGRGFGLYVQGTGPTIKNIDAHNRDTGVHLYFPTSLSMDDVRVSGARNYGLYLQSASYPPTLLSRLALTDNRRGLYLTSGGTGTAFTFNASHFSSLSGNDVAIYDGAPLAEVDAAALGLSSPGSNHYSLPLRVAAAPGPDPDCGATLDGLTTPSGSALTLNSATKTYTLVADLDCTATLNEALIFGVDGLTLQGAGKKILAPFATEGVQASGRAGVTIDDVDVSATFGIGTGVNVDGSSQVSLTNITANDRYEGVRVVGSTDVSLANLQISRSWINGLLLSQLTGSLSLSGLTSNHSRGYGLNIDGVDGDPTASGTPMTLDASVLSDLSGNYTAIGLRGDVSNLHFKGAVGAPLVLDARHHSVSADVATNHHLSFSHLDIKGTYRTTNTHGVTLKGDNHALDNIAADDWNFAVRAEEAAELAIDGLTASHSTTALWLKSISGGLALNDLTLRDSASGLEIDGLAGADGAPRIFDPDVLTEVSGNNYSVRLYNTSYLSFRGNGPADLLKISGDVQVFAAAGGVVSPNDHLHLLNVAISGQVAANGTNSCLLVGGDDHKIEDVTIDGCRLGFSLSAGDGVLVDGLNVTGAMDTAARMDGATGVTLADLRLTHGYFGLDLRNLNPATRQVIDNTVLTDLTGTDRCIAIRDSSNLEVAALTLPCTGAGIDASYTGNSDLFFTNLDVSGHRQFGHGIQSAGARLTFSGVIANDRLNAVTVYSADGLTIDDLDILRAQSITDGTGVGLWLQNLTGPISLNDLAIYDSGIALKFTNVVGDPSAPLALDSSVLPRRLDAGGSPIFSGNYTNMWFSYTQNVAMSDLFLDARSYGVDGYRAGNDGLDFYDVDASGGRRNAGIGIYLKGRNHQFVRFTAERRYYGVLVEEAEGLVVDTYSTRNTVYGLYLGTYEALWAPPSLTNLSLVESDNGIGFVNFHSPLVFDGDVIGVTLGDNYKDIYVNASSGITFSNLDLSGWIHGFYCHTTVCDDLLLADIDITGPRVGEGILLKGQNNTLRDVTITGRRYALEANGTSNLTLTRLTASNSSTGIYMHHLTSAHLPPVFDTVTLTDNRYALSLSIVSPSPPLVLDGDDMGLDFTGNERGIWFSGDGAIFRDLDVTTSQFGGIWFAGNGGLLENVNASGSGLGFGITIYGDDNRIVGGQANDREYGVKNYTTYVARNLVIDDFEARRNSTAGLYLPYIENPTWTNLRLTDNEVGLYIARATGPLTVNNASFAEFAGNRGAIDATYSKDITIEGMTLPTTGTAINATGVSTENFTVRDTDVSGYCRGYGLQLGGENAVAERVVAGTRARAIYVGSGDEILIKDSVMGASASGLYVAGTTTNLNANVIAYGATTETFFRISQTNGTHMNLAVGETIRVHLDTGVEEVVVDYVSSSYIGLGDDPTNALSKPPEVGDLVQALDVNDIRLTVETSDICANDIGMNNLGSEVTATGDYWRSATGPTHASVSGGDGDSVEGTGPSTVSPFDPLPFDNVNPYCNLIPLPDAGPDQVVCEGDTVTLDATGSTDADGDELAFGWSQPGGSLVVLSDSAVVQPTFDAPYDGAQTLDFEVLVDDGDAVRRDTVSIDVEAGNTPPTVS
ncbi:MAG: hypothetical protein ACI9MR_002094, partial [Myxococcota bacterium]